MFEYLSLLYGIDIFIKKSRIKRTTTSVNDVANDNIVTFLSLTMPSLKYKKHVTTAFTFSIKIGIWEMPGYLGNFPNSYRNFRAVYL